MGAGGGGGASSFPIKEVAVASVRPPFPDEAEAAVSGCILRVVSLGLVAAFVGQSPVLLVAGFVVVTIFSFWTVVTSDIFDTCFILTSISSSR